MFCSVTVPLTSEVLLAVSWTPTPPSPSPRPANTDVVREVRDEVLFENNGKSRGVVFYVSCFDFCFLTANEASLIYLDIPRLQGRDSVRFCLR
jgi:hypothetical protein